MNIKWYRSVFISTFVLTTIYVLRFTIEAVYYLPYYRIINTTSVTYPYRWLIPYFDGVLNYTNLTNIIIKILPLPSGWEGLNIIIMIGWLGYLIQLAILGVFLYQTVHHYMKKIRAILSIIIFFLLCNPITAEMISMGLTNTRDSISEKNSTEYIRLKNAFKQSNIKFTVISSHRVQSRSSYYFEGNKGEDYEITLRITDIPHEIDRFSLTFNEEIFDEYQIYRENMKNGTSWLIHAVRSHNTFEFRDDASGQLMNTGNPNELKFIIGIEMKKPFVDSIRISPKIDISFDDPLDHTNTIHTGYLSHYQQVDLVKYNFPVLRVK